MDKVIQMAVRNSEMVAPKDKRQFLTYPVNGLALCTLEELEDSVNFIFDAIELEQSSSVLKKPKWDKLRFLVNCAELESLSAEYDYSMSLGNLLVDVNLAPQVMLRGAKSSNATCFLQAYKALIGSVLLPKYKYAIFYATLPDLA